MHHTYNRLAGSSAERIAALSDGVFAVAMTLLVLDLHAPAAEAIHSERDLLAALGALAPRLLIYMMSFLTLGVFWVGQQSQLNHLARSDRRLTWTHLGYLFAVTLIPFSTALMAEFITYRSALVCYWLNIVLFGALLFASWQYALRHELTKQTLTPDIAAAVMRRIVVAQALYAVGALLCAVDTFVSIGVIILVQVNYAIGPNRGLLGRL